MELKFEVTGQKISYVGDAPVSGSYGRLSMKFEFSSDWDGLYKVAVIDHEWYANPVFILIGTDGTVDADALSGIRFIPGEWTVGVIGTESATVVLPEIPEQGAASCDEYLLGVFGSATIAQETTSLAVMRVLSGSLNGIDRGADPETYQAMVNAVISAKEAMEKCTEAVSAEATARIAADAALNDGKADKSTTYTKTEVDTALALKADDEDLTAEVTARGEADDAIEGALKEHQEALVLDHPDESVTTAKIKNGAVTEDKLFGGAVTASKIGPGAVIGSKIHDGVVTKAKLHEDLKGEIEAKDVLEGEMTENGFVISGDLSPCVPEGGKIYIDTVDKMTYRWDETSYEEISHAVEISELYTAVATKAENADVLLGLAKKVSNSKIGQANGVAGLDASGRIPSAQLPSYVDDVLEGEMTENGFVISGDSSPCMPEGGKIYVDSGGLNPTNKCYRWGGSVYVEISASLALGETASTAFAGNRGVTLEGKMTTAESNITTLQADLSAEATARSEADSTHRSAATIDHPDGSVTTDKIANGAVAKEKLHNDLRVELEGKADAEDVIELQGTVYGREISETMSFPFNTLGKFDNDGAATTGSYMTTGVQELPEGAVSVTYYVTTFNVRGFFLYDAQMNCIYKMPEVPPNPANSSSGTVDLSTLPTPAKYVAAQVQNQTAAINSAVCQVTYRTITEGIAAEVEELVPMIPKVTEMSVGGSKQYLFYISGLRNGNGKDADGLYYKGISVLVKSSFTNRYAHSSWIYVQGISEVSVPEGFSIGNSNGTGAYAFDENYNLIDNGATVSNNKITIADGVYWLRFAIHDDEDSGANPIPLTTSQSFSETGGVEMDGTTATTGYHSTGMVVIPEGTREIVYKGSVYNCYGVNFYDANDQFISGEFIAVTNPGQTPTAYTTKRIASVPQNAVKVLAQTIDGTEESASFEFADKIGNVSITVTGANVATNRDDTNRSFVEVDPPIDPDWENWQNERYSWFYKTQSEPIFAECYAPFEANMISVRGGKGRYGTDPENITHTPSASEFVDGGHLFEGWNADETLRLTMLIGKYDYRMACIQCYGTPELNQGERVYGYIKVGSDNKNFGVNFGEKSAKFFVPILLSTTRPTEVTAMYETGDSTAVPVGAMYYDTTYDRVRVMTANGWKSLALEA